MNTHDTQKTKNEYIIIYWYNMYFGTPKNSCCGICNVPEEGYWKNGILQEDIICSFCSDEGWEYDDEINGYKQKIQTKK